MRNRPPVLGEGAEALLHFLHLQTMSSGEKGPRFTAQLSSRFQPYIAENRRQFARNAPFQEALDLLVQNRLAQRVGDAAFVSRYGYAHLARLKLGLAGSDRVPGSANRRRREQALLENQLPRVSRQLLDLSPEQLQLRAHEFQDVDANLADVPRTEVAPLPNLAQFTLIAALYLANRDTNTPVIRPKDIFDSCRDEWVDWRRTTGCGPPPAMAAVREAMDELRLGGFMTSDYRLSRTGLKEAESLDLKFYPIEALEVGL